MMWELLTLIVVIACVHQESQIKALKKRMSVLEQWAAEHSPSASAQDRQISN